MWGCMWLIKQGEVKLESKTNLDHVRGALKAYRKDCFKQIGGLVNRMGWDSVDEYKARYHNWKVKVIPDLMVAHLKETNIKTGHTRASFKMDYALYDSFRHPTFNDKCLKRLLWKPYIIQGIAILCGYFYAFLFREEKIIDKKLGRFIRKYRYSKIIARFTNTK